MSQNKTKPLPTYLHNFMSQNKPDIKVNLTKMVAGDKLGTTPKLVRGLNGSTFSEKLMVMNCTFNAHNLSRRMFDQIAMKSLIILQQVIQMSYVGTNSNQLMSFMN